MDFNILNVALLDRVLDDLIILKYRGLCDEGVDSMIIMVKDQIRKVSEYSSTPQE